jgi:hypothetical protein
MLHVDHRAKGFKAGYQKMPNANCQLHKIEQML